MIKEGKYIVFKDGTSRVFSVNSFHIYMTGGKEVSSAGFYGFEKNMLVCFGESTTLGVKSHPDDSEIIREQHLASITPKE